jgi:hypothetical protein
MPFANQRRQTRPVWPMRASSRLEPLGLGMVAGDLGDQCREFF